MYEELIAKLRGAKKFFPGYLLTAKDFSYELTPQDLCEAANAIEELTKTAKAMHTWIFLNTGDEQKVYDECGLSDEMNAVLGYGGQFVVEPPKGE